MKSILQKIGLLMVMLLATIDVYAYDFEVDGIYYNLTSASGLTCEVTYSEHKYRGYVEIPSHVTYMGKKLTVCHIGHDCFAESDQLISITLPETIEDLGDRCFKKCTNLNSINIPEKILYISRESFKDCKKLKSIKLPKNCSVGPYAFQGCTGLSKVEIDGDIWYGAFNDCDRDIEFTLRPNVNEIMLCYVTIDYIFPDLYTYYLFYKDKYLTFNKSFRSLIIEDGEEPIKIQCYMEDSDKKMTGTAGYVNLEESWGGENVETLYLGRDLINETEYPEKAPKLSLPNLKSLTIGPNITDVESSISFGDKYSNSLTFLKSLSLKPPYIPSTFSEFQYLFMDVEVPKESLELYKKDPVWGKFLNLKASGVQIIGTEKDCKEIGRYDLSGSPVNDSYKGLVIVRYSDGSAKKLIQ